jgi:hypothetical protein
VIDWFGFMMFNATFNNISAILLWSVLLVEETGGPGENHRPVASHWQTLSLKCCILAWAGFELTTLMMIDCIGSYKSYYHYDHDHDGSSSVWRHFTPYQLYITWPSVMLVEETGENIYFVIIFSLNFIWFV